MIRKDVIIVLIAVLCLTTSLFMIKPTISQSVREYDPWYDINDDGQIDVRDIYAVSLKYGTTGTPINKTQMLLDLQNRVKALEQQQDYIKTIRFYTSNEAMNNQTEWKDAAVFVWTPNNSTNNAILLTSCYLQYWGEDYGENPNTFLYGVFVEGTERELWTQRLETSDNYTWSPMVTHELVPNNPSQYVFPNQENYTIKLRFKSDMLGLEVYVKSINILLEVMDGLPPN